MAGGGLLVERSPARARVLPGLLGRVRGRPPLLERFVTLNGIELRVVEAGSGAPVLLLPSLLIRADTYRPLLEALATRFSVVAVELPGSGRSAPIDTTWSVERYAAFVRRFVQARELKRPVVIGHSNSGPIAMRVGADAAPVCSAVVLADIIGVRAASLARVLFDRVVDGLFELRLDLRAAWHLPYNLARHPRSFLRQVRASAGTSAFELAPHVRIPSLVMWARRDRTMPFADGEALAARIPGARLFVAPGRHDWLMLKPNVFVRALAGFLDEQRAPDGHGGPFLPPNGRC